MKPALAISRAAFVAVAASVALTPAGPATAKQKGAVVGIENAVRQAVGWHPSVAESLARLGQQVESINEARAGYEPRISGGIGMDYSNTGRRGVTPVFSLSASQMIYDFGKVSSSVESAQAGAGASRALVLLAVDNLIRDTAHAVIEVQRNSGLLRVAQQQVVGVERISQLVLRRSGEGASTRSDQIQALARVQEAESTLLEIEAQLLRWQSNLAFLMGVNKAVAVSPEVPKWMFKACDIDEPDWAQVPGMVQAESLQRKAVADLDHSRAEALPTLSLEASGQVDLNDFSSSGEPEFNVGLKLSGNLYQGGAAKARRNAAGYALRAAASAKERVRYDVGKNLMEARNQTASMLALLKTLSTRGSMMAETRDLYREQYVELGTRTLLDLLDAERELHAAHFQSVNVTHDLRNLRADCVYNSGRSRSSFGVFSTSVRGVSLR